VRATFRPANNPLEPTLASPLSPRETSLGLAKRLSSQPLCSISTSKQQGMQVTDVGGIIAEIIALSKACYTDPKPIFGILCGSI
jgi:hypothetical protein